MSKVKYEYGYPYGYGSDSHYGYNCRICGYRMESSPWSNDEKYGLDEICPCCGGQSGLNDDSPSFARENRLGWGVGQNMKWHQPSKKPNGWSWEKQKRQIPPAFRDLEDGGWQ